MSARYQRQYTIPEGLPSLLKNFSREVLRQQPENIYEFGSRYFSDLAAELAAAAQKHAAGEGGNGKDLMEMSASELADFILNLFLEYDTDRSGYLDHTEFQAIMTSRELGLSKKDIRKVMAECDENDDGVLEYREFLPIMVQLIHGMKAKKEAEASRDAQQKGAKQAVEAHLIHGVPREELEAMMRNVFKAADVNGDGCLDRSEFKRCLKSSDMGFTRREVNILLAEADTNGDGSVSYEEFMPLCFSILVERFSDELLTAEAASAKNPDTLSAILLQKLASVDTHNLGLLPIHSIKNALTELSRESLGLTLLQILAVLSEADVDPTGMVKYAKFVPTASRMINSICDLSKAAQRAAAIQQVSLLEGAQELHGLDRHTVKQIMFTAFEQADQDRSGALDSSEISTVLHSLSNSNLNLNQQQINSLLASMDVNEDGLVHYGELIDFMFDVLLHLEREASIQRIAQRAVPEATMESDIEGGHGGQEGHVEALDEESLEGEGHDGAVAMEEDRNTKQPATEDARAE